MGSVDVENLLPSFAVGQPNADVHLEAAAAEQCVVDELLPVGHPDDQHVVELRHPIELRQQLVDDRIADARRVASQRASRPAEGIQLVQHDHVQLRLRSSLRLLELRLGEELG